LGPVKDGTIIGNPSRARIDIKRTDVTVVRWIHRIGNGKGEISIRVINDMASLFEECEAELAVIFIMNIAL